MRLIKQLTNKLFVKQSITSSQSLLQLLLGNGSGSRISDKHATQQSAVFQCTRVLSESIGAMPVGLYVKDGQGRIKATSHPVNQLISQKPNSFQTPAEFYEMLMVHLCFRGNFTAKIVRLGDGTVRELIPFHPDQVSRELNDDYEIIHTVKYGKGKEETFNDNDIFHVKIFSENGVDGLNPIEYARKSIGLSANLERHGAALFKNGARPGGVLSTDARIEKDQATAYREMWEQANGGDKQGGTAVLGNGLKYQAIGMNSADSQWLESRSFQKTDIAGFYRVPPHKINIMDNATFSNIEHQSLEFVRDSLTPYAVKIEQRMNRSLLTQAELDKGYYTKINFNSILRGDTTARAEFYSSMTNNGAISPNEIRALEELNPYEGGDSFLRPLNMAVVGDESSSET